MTFEEWKDGYGLVLEPNYSKETEADCLAAFNFWKRESAVLIERQAAQIEMMRSTLHGIVDADWRKWEELASPEEFVRWAKSRANHVLSTTPEQALEQFAAKVRDQCDFECYKSNEYGFHRTYLDISNGIRSIKELP